MMRHRMVYALQGVLLSCLLTGAALAQQDLLVLVPGAMAEAMERLKPEFEAAHPDIRLLLDIGHTPSHLLMLEQGVQADVALIAARGNVNRALEANVIDADSVVYIAANRLVAIMPEANPANISQVSDLAAEGVSLLLAAQDLPIGVATANFLAAADALLGEGFADALLANVVSRELGVRPIVTKITLGEADAGIVFSSDAALAQVQRMALPEGSDAGIAIAVAATARTEKLEAVQQFSAFLQSAEVQARLETFGFVPVP